MSKLARTLAAAGALAGAALIAVPSGASAATTIGQTFAPATATQCAANYTYLQSTSPGGQYAAPTVGVITGWSFQASAANVPQLKFKVARPAGGDSFTVIAESAVVTPQADKLNTFPVQIAVQAGDIIGFFTNTAGHCAQEPAGYIHHAKAGDVAPSTTPVLFTAFGGQLDVSALLEPDCDKDGLGDETQDPNLSTCAAPGPGSTSVFCKGKPATIVGTAGNDVRSGTPGNDVMVGQGGNDALSGLAGRDLICGGAGKDKLNGGSGNDFLSGQKGKDKLRGGKGKDKLSGKAGKDLCVGGPGTDKAKGCEKTKSI
jgi:Ca2+-binding RTX toxin-like protein